MEEAFLINPARIRRRRRARGRKKGGRRRKGLPGPLLRRMMKTYGRRRGMKEAWSAYRRGARRNPSGLAGLSMNRRRRRRSRRQRNPLGEEVMIVGANPRRKRRRRRARSRKRGLLGFSLNPRRRRRRRRYAASNRPIRRRRRRRRAAAVWSNPPRRRRRRRSRRRMYSNPRRARAAGLPALSFRRPLGLLMPLAVGTAGYIAADRVPAMVNITGTLPRLGVKAAVGIGGGMLISKFMGRQNAAVWTIGVGINLFSDLLRTYVFKTGLSGYGAFPYQEYGAYPDEFRDYPTGEGYSPY